jgi:hypothetical protein
MLCWCITVLAELDIYTEVLGGPLHRELPSVDEFFAWNQGEGSFCRELLFAENYYY